MARLTPCSRFVGGPGSARGPRSLANLLGRATSRTRPRPQALVVPLPSALPRSAQEVNDLIVSNMATGGRSTPAKVRSRGVAAADSASACWRRNGAAPSSPSIPPSRRASFAPCAAKGQAFAPHAGQVSCIAAQDPGRPAGAANRARPVSCRRACERARLAALAASIPLSRLYARLGALLSRVRARRQSDRVLAAPRPSTPPAGLAPPPQCSRGPARGQRPPAHA